MPNAVIHVIAGQYYVQNIDGAWPSPQFRSSIFTKLSVSEYCVIMYVDFNIDLDSPGQHQGHCFANFLDSAHVHWVVGFS
jgi:hypothetical protein